MLLIGKICNILGGATAVATASTMQTTPRAHRMPQDAFCVHCIVITMYGGGNALKSILARLTATVRVEFALGNLQDGKKQAQAPRAGAYGH